MNNTPPKAIGKGRFHEKLLFGVSERCVNNQMFLIDLSDKLFAEKKPLKEKEDYAKHLENISKERRPTDLNELILDKYRSS